MKEIEAGNRPDLEALSSVHKQFSLYFTNYRVFGAYQTPILQMKFWLIEIKKLAVSYTVSGEARI